MNRLLAALPALLSYGIAFAETAEEPMESAGMGGIIGFFVVCIVMVVAFVWYTNKSSQQSPQEKAGDKLP